MSNNKIINYKRYRKGKADALDRFLMILWKKEVELKLTS